ncbi:hypothetical protein AYK24_06560 [Thermoplasmatales archaeon SG8-52-4]|nr:MAG: hypothetical protein AYK24_06560 [Thermoplasmatales archaeon SG8-52-4]
MERNKVRQKELEKIAAEIRKMTNIPESVSDRDVLAVTEGSLTYEVAELRVALRNLKVSIIKHLHIHALEENKLRDAGKEV